MKPAIERVTDGRIILTFPASALPFVASAHAERYLKARGFSVGRRQAHAPSGILFGRYDIQKWRNLRPIERTSLHGQMSNNGRHGPIKIELFASAPAEARRAITKPPTPGSDYRTKALVVASDLAVVATMIFSLGAVAYVGLYPIWAQKPASMGKFALRISEAPPLARSSQ